VLKGILDPNSQPHRAFTEQQKRAGKLENSHILRQMPMEQWNGYIIIPFAFTLFTPLTERIRQGISSLDFVLDLAIHAADALTAAHESGITHGNLTPRNLLLTPVDQLQIAGLTTRWIPSDFELPTSEIPLLHDKSKQAVPRPFANEAYQAPEQLSGKNVNAQTDLYSLGVILYELLTGEFLFQADSVELLHEQILQKQILPLNKVRPATPVIWTRILKALIAKDPAKRYPSARDLLGDLQQIRWGFSIDKPAFISKNPNLNRRSFFRRFIPDLDL
jgi:serine/threonine-protein kinase